ncbi:MAG: 2-amino-4-hydroxy-6-hydroxymethyldihydropteridine diphosphokinase, partial [Aquificae bacterium]|nr:2-amino-4-hydroxy-6-hydroxymethyldihydropteridine diphosphokinase [Aquificota bacterium]
MKVYLALGSNLGDRLGYILKALDLLSEFLYIERLSTVYESAPWGLTGQPPFLNLVVRASYRGLPNELLLKLLKVEKRVGRKRRTKWGPREIDIDLLLFGNEVINTKLLTVPHPYLKERDFFLYPLLEIDKELKD